MIYFKWVCLSTVLYFLLGCASVGTVHNEINYDTKPAEASKERLSRAELAFNRGRFADALQQYSEVLRQDPNHRDALIAVGRIYLQVGQLRTAISYFSKVLEANAEDAVAAEERGLAHFKLDERETALADFQLALRVDPGRWRSWNVLGILADLNGNSVDARAYYYRALEVIPESPTLINNIGYSFLMDGHYAQAESMLHKGLVMGFEDLVMRNNLSMAIAWQGRYEEAIQVIDGVLPRHSALNNVGYIAMSRGDIEKAKQLFNKALDISPSYYVRAAKNLSKAESMAIVELKASHPPE